jgi:hypothetical protein
MHRMNWLLLAALPVLVAPSVTRSQNPQFRYAIRIPGLGGLACVDGRAGFFDHDRARGEKRKDGAGEAIKPKEIALSWRITRTERGHTIQAADTATYAGWYLSFDPDEPRKGVFLRKERTDGSYWDIREIPTSSTPTYPIMARVPDPERRWYLDYDPEDKIDTTGAAAHFKAKLTEGKGPAINMYEHAP